MRKSTVRNGMRLVMAALVLIIGASFYHVQLADWFYLSHSSEVRIYRLGMFWAAAIGGYGVVVAAFGLAFSPLKKDANIRLKPVFLALFVLVIVFFYLLSASIEAPFKEEQYRLRPGETITI